MSMKIGELIDKLIADRARGNPAIAEMTRAKLILKGFDSNKYELKCCDEPEIVEKLIEFKDDWNYEIFQEDSLPFITAFSHKETPAEVILDIHKAMSRSDIKVLIYFAAPSYDQDKLSRLMDKAFAGSIVFGCSSAGEKADDKLMTDSVVALGLSSKIAADAKVEVLENLDKGIDVKPAFKSFSRYFNDSAFTMDVDKYVGIVLIDGLSRKEERVIDEIGNATNVSFVGGSAGDYLKFEQTLVGIISFDCIYRRLELADKELTEEYGEIFKDIPSLGLCSYGEANIGFMNQTSTMLILKYENLDKDQVVQADTFPDQVVQSNVVQEQVVPDNAIQDQIVSDNVVPDHNFQCIAIQDQDIQNNAAEKTTTISENSQLTEENLQLHIKIEELERKLEQATEELRIFNRLLEKEIHERTKKEEYITYISYHDELTGLYYRRYYEQAVIDIDKEDNFPISIIVEMSII